MVQLLTGTNTGNCIKISSSTYSFSVTKNSSHSVLKLSADVRATLLAGSFKSLHTLLNTIHAYSLPFNSRRDGWREFVIRKQTKVSRDTGNTSPSLHILYRQYWSTKESGYSELGLYSADFVRTTMSSPWWEQMLLTCVILIDKVAPRLKNSCAALGTSNNKETTVYFPKEQMTVKQESCGFKPSEESMNMVNYGASPSIMSVCGKHFSTG